MHGAEASVNFQYSALVEEGTTKVLRLRAANGKEIPLRAESAPQVTISWRCSLVSRSRVGCSAGKRVEVCFVGSK